MQGKNIQMIQMIHNVTLLLFLDFWNYNLVCVLLLYTGLLLPRVIFPLLHLQPVYYSQNTSLFKEN